MKTVTLSGIPFKAWSPSLFSLDVRSSRIAIGFNGRAWQIAVNETYGEHEWPTREQAAELVAEAFAGCEPTVHVS